MRILLVEDDPDISRFLVKGLTEERHVVDLVENGQEAEERARKEARREARERQQAGQASDKAGDAGQ